MLPDEALEFWVDVNLPPSLAVWLNITLGVSAKSFQELGLLTAGDKNVYDLASQSQNIVVIPTKDIDYLDFANGAKGVKVLLVSTGNISHQVLRRIFLEA